MSNSNQKFVKTAMPSPEELAARVAEAQKRAGAASVRTVVVAPVDDPSPGVPLAAPTPPHATAPGPAWTAAPPAPHVPPTARPTDTAQRARPAARPSSGTVIREMYAPATESFAQSTAGRALILVGLFAGAASIIVLGLWIAGVFRH